MPQPLTARVTPDGATSFEATITNLTPSSLFLRAASDLRFRQSVTMELGTLTLYGEVAFVCHEPPGALVVFRATVEDLHTLEDHMEEVAVVEGGEPWTPLSDEDPTNPAEKIPSLASIRRRAPPNASTDVDGNLSGAVVQPGPRVPTLGPSLVDPTDVPTVDAVADAATFTEAQESTVLEESTEHGVAQPRTVFDEPLDENRRPGEDD